ncbi:MAG TPA: TIGR04282 family arsenosugar biosynthesis glycosyltransferase [Chthoniobacterales bacterium]|nr:TIGR04282 family arsenosugar biosynthesis glycosyltransferase [Chthoniobacterales bacterium]
MKHQVLIPDRQDPALENKCALGIMIKTPKPGFSKSRRSPPLSLEEAASLSSCFLRDKSETIEALCREDPFVVGVAVYTPAGSESDLEAFLAPGFKMIPQREVDFGARLFGAVEDLFSVGFSAVCLLDSDSPTIPVQHLNEMAALLKEPEDRVVIGPSTDGGYYCVGLRRAHARLFEEITWSTSRVKAQTVERAKEIDLSVIELPPWYDVDDELSLARLLSELFPEAANQKVVQGAPAPKTKAFLGQILAEEGPERIWPSASLPMV